MALTDDLVAFWGLEEASGTRNDSHGSNHLTDNNTVASATGKVGNCADFESGSNQFLSRADTAALSFADEDFAIALWLNLETVTNSQILRKNGAIDVEYGVEIFASGVRFVVYGPSSSNEAYSWAVVPLSVATWYYVVCWHDSVANTLNVQVNDGTTDSTSYSGGCRDLAGSIGLGADPVYGGYFDGKLDQVGVWRRTLTSGERTSLYNGGAGMSYADMGGGGGGAAGQPTMRRFGGVPHMGGRMSGAAGRSGPWGYSKSGHVVVPQWISDQERKAA